MAEFDGGTSTVLGVLKRKRSAVLLKPLMLIVVAGTETETI